MAAYESVFILRPDLDREGVDKTCERIVDVVTRSGGSVLSVEKVGLRRLAYEIEHFSDGFYVILNYEGEPSATRELERFFKINDEVIRYLIVKREVPFEKPQTRRTKASAEEAAGDGGTGSGGTGDTTEDGRSAPAAGSGDLPSGAEAGPPGE
ncbi:MAG TPA: 30S ribosomal protein S6 [Clostridiales bacterium]|mgnify:CR=1 FL=1|nr:30S ribosomal protein S6 [Clostridiales bacterium]